MVMTVWRDRAAIPASPPRASAVTIGNFDGVHRGHQTLLARTLEWGRAHDAQAVALTFDPHPVHVHCPDRGFRLIMTLDDRLDALAGCGIDATLVVTYNEALYRLTPEEFVRSYLVEGLAAAAVIVGRDVRFGVNNSGDLATLRELGQLFGFEVVVVADCVDENDTRISSSRIRQLLDDGDVEAANTILTRPFRIRGTVVHGFKRGRELGFPTANLDDDDLMTAIPADGVYAGWLSRRVSGTEAEEFLPAAISVGTNPQFDGTRRTVEAHVLGRCDLNLYGEEISLSFLQRLRGMETFDSLDALLTQMDDDIRRAAAVLGVGVSGRVNPEDVTAL